MSFEEAYYILSSEPVVYHNPDEQGKWDEAMKLALSCLLSNIRYKSDIRKTIRRNLNSAMLKVSEGFFV